MQSNYLLSVKGLCKSFDKDLFVKKQTIVSNLNLDFLSGACTGLLGHNGAGKTTTIRLILGLLKPDQGEIIYKGQPFSRTDRYEIGYMPETNKLPLSLTCEEILRRQADIFLPNLGKAEKSELVDRMLKQVELEPHRKKKIGKLSKGMGRRIAWASATIHFPKLLILDEPFSGLDPYGRLLMKQWINDLKASDTTIILCTHELDTIKTICDQIQIIKHGKLVFSTMNSDFSVSNGVNYCLRLSSVDQNQVNDLQKKHSLPEVSSIRTEGKAQSLFFRNYKSVIEWTKACFNQGIVVLAVEDQGLLSEEILMNHFSLEVK